MISGFHASSPICPSHAKIKEESARARPRETLVRRRQTVRVAPASCRSRPMSTPCVSKTCGVTVLSDENVTRYRCRRDGLWRSRDARATNGVLGKGARRANVTKVVDEEAYLVATTANGSSPSFVPCARCGDAWYCDARCLSSDWPRHRKDCAGVRRSFAPRDASGVIEYFRIL